MPGACSTPATQGHALTDKDYFNVLSAGRQYEDKTREGLEETYKKWAEEKEYPIKMLNLLLASLGMTPYGRTETTDKTESGMSSTKSKGGTDFGSLLSGGAGLLSAFMGVGPGSQDQHREDRHRQRARLAGLRLRLQGRRQGQEDSAG